MKPGETVFTTSGVFTVPNGVKELQVFCVGGGGGGNGGDGYVGGGGGGGYTNTDLLKVSKGSSIQITIGSGGIFADGGSTSVESISSNGGCGAGKYFAGHDGGSGGGGGGTGGSGYFGGAGGSNGGNGNVGYTIASFSFQITVINGGIGQGRTTRAFGESEGTLYSGGGGGGRASGPNSGGAGGGGNAVWADGSVHQSTPGSVNTGGGGGGGGNNGAFTTSYNWGAHGGSGIAIIRWGY